LVKNVYVVWVKIDETLPWIELKGTYQTMKAAKTAATEARSELRMKIVNAPSEGMPGKAFPPPKVTS
jgi:hypothetical protein